MKQAAGSKGRHHWATGRLGDWADWHDWADWALGLGRWLSTAGWADLDHGQVQVLCQGAGRQGWGELVAWVAAAACLLPVACCLLPAACCRRQGAHD